MCADCVSPSDYLAGHGNIVLAKSSLSVQGELVPLNVGDRLGHYDVTALIGEGGMDI